VVGFAGQIVSFALGPFAGVWVDRLDRRKLLLWTQIAATAHALLLALLTLTHAITLWEVIALTGVQGLINAFDTPARQVFLSQLIDEPQDLVNAIALNSSMINVARLLGPAIGGAVIAATNEGWCFLTDGISYFAAIASLLAIRVAPLPARTSKAGMLAQMREGWDYVSGTRPLRSILVLFGLISLMGYPYVVLMPVIAGQVLHGGAHTLGLLMTASGAGGLISAVSLTLRKSARGLPAMILTASLLLGVALVLFGFSHSLWFSLLLLGAAGFGLIQVASASNTILQTLADFDKRARVTSYFTMAFYGAAPLGSLFAGLLADRIGAPMTIVATGACCIAGGAWFAREVTAIKNILPLPSAPDALAPT
jgi:MFS family permease